MGSVVCTALISGAFFQLFGQSSQALPSFEIASIKPYEGPPIAGSLSISGPRLTIRGFTVGGLLLYAYNVKDYLIEKFWSLDRTRYDILAAAGDGRARTREEFRILMQALLAERFQARVHREMKEMPVYALVVDKSGPKFKESLPDANDAVKFETKGRSIGRTLPKGTMEDVAEGIRNNAGLDRPIVDKTGLSGHYTIHLIYTPESRMSHDLEPDPSEISVFTAVKEQLGLRLERQNALIEMLIIDHIERPSEN